MKSSDEEGAGTGNSIILDREDFPLPFKEYRDRELHYSRLWNPALFSSEPFSGDDVEWVFWNRQEDNPDRTLPNDHLKVRRNIVYALQSSMCLGLRQCLVQFWAPTETAEGRALLTTEFQPFAIGATRNTSSRYRLCEYRMEMCREYKSFYADAESREEQLGLPGRVFLNQLPESTPAVEYYTPKEYPQRDLALRCGIKGSWAVPVFEHFGHTCVGVLEIVSEHNGPQGWYNGEFLRSNYDIFQEFGLRCFDGYKHCKMQNGDANKARTAAFQELKMVYEPVCKTHNLPLALTWVSSRSCNDLLLSQPQFSVLDYDGKVNWDEDFYKNLAVFIKASKVCPLRKGLVTGGTLQFPNLLYCLDVKQLSIAEFPLVPYARFCSLGGWFTMCLRSSLTGDKLYVIEFFFPESNENNENILTKLRLILATMEEYFKTFKLASGQGLGEALYVKVIDFQNGQKSHSIQMIPAIRCISGLELLQYGGVMFQQDQQDKPSMDAISIGMDAVIEAQNYNLPSLDSLQNGKVMMQLDSSDQWSMDPSNNGQNVVTAERNIFGKRKIEDREHKKAGVKIEIPIEDIHKCSNMSRKDAAAALNVGISTLKRVCREYGILRWPPRYVKQVQPFPPLPVEKKGPTSQLNFDLHSNEASNTETGFQDADMVAIKAIYNKDTTIKFRLRLSSRFVELQEEVAKRLSLEAGTYSVKYKDVEDEFILLSCDEDLQECMHTFRSLGKTSVVVFLKLEQPITNLNPGLSGGQQTLFSPLRRQGLRSAEGELSIVPTVHTMDGMSALEETNNSANLCEQPIVDASTEEPMCDPSLFPAEAEDWLELDALLSYTPSTDEEETTNKCMQDGSFLGEC